MGALLSWLPGLFGQDRTLRVRPGGGAPRPVVVALAEAGTGADLSNSCGIAAGRCRAVPGTGFEVAPFGSLGIEEPPSPPPWSPATSP